jgi:hypothetical protein
MSGSTLQAQAELVRRRAADLAGEMSRSARRTATIAQERAVLRMLGVDGLDRAGRPLSASLAERYFGSDRSRLARGVILPFVAALLEYDLPARDLALDVASGAIDLGLEAELLERPDRLAATEKRASAMIDAALVRFDANRTVSRGSGLLCRRPKRSRRLPRFGAWSMAVQTSSWSAFPPAGNSPRPAVTPVWRRRISSSSRIAFAAEQVIAVEVVAHEGPGQRPGPVRSGAGAAPRRRSRTRNRFPPAVSAVSPLCARPRMTPRHDAAATPV